MAMSREAMFFAIVATVTDMLLTIWDPHKSIDALFQSE